jgi:hypothetical protein
VVEGFLVKMQEKEKIHKNHFFCLVVSHQKNAIDMR